MNKQTKTYLLLALVLVIWGAVAYQIISGLSPDETEEVATTLQPLAKTKTKARDTFSIAANYRDPFLGTLPAKKRSTAPKTIAKPSIPAPNIQYTGSMGGEGAARIFFVNINGQQHLMKKGQTQNEVKLLSGDASSITIRFNGQSQKIALTQ